MALSGDNLYINALDVFFFETISKIAKEIIS